MIIQAACLLCLLGATPPSAAPAPTTAPTTAPADDLATRREQIRKELEASQGNLSRLGTFKIADVVHLTYEGRSLLVESNLPTQERPMRINIEGLPGITSAGVRRLASAEADPPATAPKAKQPLQLFFLSHYSFSEPTAIVTHTSINMVNGDVQITGDWDFPDGHMAVALQDRSASVVGREQADSMVHMQIRRLNGEGQLLVQQRFDAPDLPTLLWQHPREVNECLRPVLHQLRQEAVLTPAPNAAWQLFMDQWAINPAAETQVKALVAKLDADEFREREAASRQLKAMGRDAALILARMDRQNLSAQQRALLDTLLASYQPVPADWLPRLRTNPDFLLSCLYIDEAPIQKAALAQLRQVCGREISFDLTATADARAAAIEKLRAELADRPATRPGS